jgi:hypothetical protein
MFHATTQRRNEGRLKIFSGDGTGGRVDRIYVELQGIPKKTG